MCSIRQKCREFAIALLIFLQLYSCSGSLAYLDYRQGKRASTEWFLYSDWGLRVVGLFWPFGCVQTTELEVGDVETGWGCESLSKYANLLGSAHLLLLN